MKKELVKVMYALIMSLTLKSGALLHPTPPPVDVSFCIADLKFDGHTVKICELGLCTWSYFKGHEALFGQGKIWQHIWQHLGRFSLPIWYVGRCPLSDSRKREMAYKDFINSGGTFIDSLDTLSLSLSSTASNRPITNMHDITQYRGIVVLRNRHHKETKESIEAFRLEHPEVIIMDTAAAPYVNNKAATNKLFSDQKIAHLKPSWRIYEKGYTRTMAQQIVKECDHPMYVIKPTSSAEGRGIIIVEQQHLNDTLKKIFTDQAFLKYHDDPSFNYWAYDKQPDFIIEEYAPSKAILVDEKRYDATMRVVFALTYHHEEKQVDFLGYYWKLPAHDLDYHGSLNDKHKSKISGMKHGQSRSSAIVETSDAVTVSDMLRAPLAILYEKMLKN